MAQSPHPAAHSQSTCSTRGGCASSHRAAHTSRSIFASCWSSYAAQSPFSAIIRCKLHFARRHQLCVHHARRRMTILRLTHPSASPALQRHHTAQSHSSLLLPPGRFLLRTALLDPAAIAPSVAFHACCACIAPSAAKLARAFRAQVRCFLQNKRKRRAQTAIIAAQLARANSH